MSGSSSGSESEWKTVQDFTKSRIHPEDLRLLLDTQIARYQQNGSQKPAEDRRYAIKTVGPHAMQAVMADEMSGGRRSSRELVMDAAGEVMRNNLGYLPELDAQLAKNEQNRNQGIHPDDYAVLLEAQARHYQQSGHDLPEGRKRAEAEIDPLLEKVTVEQALTNGSRSSRDLVMDVAGVIMGNNPERLQEVGNQLAQNEHNKGAGQASAIGVAAVGRAPVKAVGRAAVRGAGMEPVAEIGRGLVNGGAITGSGTAGHAAVPSNRGGPAGRSPGGNHL